MVARVNHRTICQLSGKESAGVLLDQGRTTGINEPNRLSQLAFDKADARYAVADANKFGRRDFNLSATGAVAALEVEGIPTKVGGTSLFLLPATRECSALQLLGTYERCYRVQLILPAEEVQLNRLEVTIWHRIYLGPVQESAQKLKSRHRGRCADYHLPRSSCSADFRAYMMTPGLELHPARASCYSYCLFVCEKIEHTLSDRREGKRS